MVKHRRYSDKPKEDSTRKDEKTEFQEQEISSEKTSFDLKDSNPLKCDIPNPKPTK